MSIRVRADAVLPDTTEQGLLTLWPTLSPQAQQFLHDLFHEILVADAPLLTLLEELEELEDIQAYDAAVAAGGPLLPVADLLAQLPATEAAYIQAALAQAVYEPLVPDRTIYGSVPGLQGVWANEATQDLCRDELASVIHDWITVRRQEGLSLPNSGRR